MKNKFFDGSPSVDVLAMGILVVSFVCFARGTPTSASVGVVLVMLGACIYGLNGK